MSGQVPDRRALRLWNSLRTAVFFLAAPGVMGGLVPWVITDWASHSPPWPLTAAGFGLLVLGVAALLDSFVRFVIEGEGTPAPTAPTEFLVRGGLYRYVRNPMYLAVTAVILGQAALLGRAELAGYALVFWLVTAAFVRFYEEPALTRAYGPGYRAYRGQVRAWIPRRLGNSAPGRGR